MVSHVSHTSHISHKSHVIHIYTYTYINKKHTHISYTYTHTQHTNHVSIQQYAPRSSRPRQARFGSRLRSHSQGGSGGPQQRGQQPPGEGEELGLSQHHGKGGDVKLPVPCHIWHVLTIQSHPIQSNQIKRIVCMCRHSKFRCDARHIYMELSGKYVILMPVSVTAACIPST